MCPADERPEANKVFVSLRSSGFDPCQGCDRRKVAHHVNQRQELGLPRQEANSWATTAWFRPWYHFSFHDRTATSSSPSDDQPFELATFDSQIFTLASTCFNRWVRKARWKSALPKNGRN